MKPVRLSCILILATLAICSCKNSPSTIVAGNYSGPYTRDTVILGAATSNVTDINPLTVSIIVDLENDPDFNLNNVAVNSDSVGYELQYNGTEGTMTGTILGTHLNWTLMSATDTISFTGTKQP